MQSKLSLGRVVITSNADHSVNASAVMAALIRHERCDWGDVCNEDRKSNNVALDADDPQRILSSYKDGDTKFWIITEWDRSVTTVLLPSDY